MSQVHNSVFAVAFESLYATYDSDKKTYGLVDKDDQSDLLNDVNTVKVTDFCLLISLRLATRYVAFQPHKAARTVPEKRNRSTTVSIRGLQSAVTQTARLSA